MVYRERGEIFGLGRAGMVNLAYQRVERTWNEHLVPPLYGFSVSHFRTYREVFCRAALASFTGQEFHGPDLVIKPNLLQWNRPILTADRRYFQRFSTHEHFK